MFLSLFNLIIDTHSEIEQIKHASYFVGVSAVGAVGLGVRAVCGAL